MKQQLPVHWVDWITSHKVRSSNDAGRHFYAWHLVHLDFKSYTPSVQSSTSFWVSRNRTSSWSDLFSNAMIAYLIRLISIRVNGEIFSMPEIEQSRLRCLPFPLHWECFFSKEVRAVEHGEKSHVRVRWVLESEQMRNSLGFTPLSGNHLNSLFEWANWWKRLLLEILIWGVEHGRKND